MNRPGSGLPSGSGRRSVIRKGAAALRYGTSSRHAFPLGRSRGLWLIVSALFLAALLVPPLLLPLLLVLPVGPLLASMRLDWALAQAPAPQVSSRPRCPRGPPRA